MNKPITDTSKQPVTMAELRARFDELKELELWMYEPDNHALLNDSGRYALRGYIPYRRSMLQAQQMSLTEKDS